MCCWTVETANRGGGDIYQNRQNWRDSIETVDWAAVLILLGSWAVETIGKRKEGGSSQNYCELIEILMRFNIHCVYSWWESNQGYQCWVYALIRQLDIFSNRPLETQLKIDITLLNRWPLMRFYWDGRFYQNYVELEFRWTFKLRFLRVIFFFKITETMRYINF